MLRFSAIWIELVDTPNSDKRVVGSGKYALVVAVSLLLRRPLLFSPIEVFVEGLYVLDVNDGAFFH